MICSHCHRERNENSFRLDHNGQLGDRLHKTCNVCRDSARLRPRYRPERKFYNNKYREEHRIERLTYNYIKTELCIKFGYDAVELARYNIEHTRIQSNCCSVCGSRAKHLVLDHNHITGQLRGMVCRRCNLGIGNLRDSADICHKAAEYLTKHNFN
jgi:uncharacterized metal-binding protein